MADMADKVTEHAESFFKKMKEKADKVRQGDRHNKFCFFFPWNPRRFFPHAAQRR